MNEQNLNDSSAEDEISLKEIVDFFVNSWKVIALTAVFGICGAVLYIVLTPKSYEGTMQVQMSQLPAGGNASVSPLGVNIEDPALLIARFKIPSTYDESNVAACSLSGKPHALELLAKNIIISPLKGNGSVVEVKVRDASVEKVTRCLESVFEKIRVTQIAIKTPFLEEAKQKITLYESKLKESKAVIAKADAAKSALSAAYLSTRDEVRQLTDQLMDLNDFISAGENRRAKLIAPIYVSDIPVAPKKSIALVEGLFGGILLGILWCLFRRVWLNYRPQ